MAYGEPGPMAKEAGAKLQQQLEQIVWSGQILGVTNQQLAEKYNVTRQTIADRLRKIFEELPEEEVGAVYTEFKVLFDRLFRECNKLLNEANTAADKERAIKLTLLAVREKTDLLERFHFKPRAVDNIAIKADLTVNHRFEELRKIYNAKRKL